MKSSQNRHDLPPDLGARAIALGQLLAVVLPLLLFSALYLAWDVANLNGEIHKEIARSSSIAPTVIEETLVKKNALAILVLDLSGSMKQSDDTHEQYEALATFLRIYRHISQGAVESGSHPHLGLVVYSEIARCLGADGNPWLALDSSSDVDEILSYMESIVGSRHSDDADPRIGLRTDHVAAAKAVRELAEEYHRKTSSAGQPASTCIVFMTDGRYDPSPLTDAALDATRSRNNRKAFWTHMRESTGVGSETLSSLESQFDDWLQAANRPLEFGARFTTDELFPLISLRRACAGAMSNGALRYDGAEKTLPLAGVDASPLALRRICGLGADAPFFPILLAAPGAAVEGWGRSVAAQDLAFSFAAALAEWLELKTIPVDGEGGFSVQPDSRALAVLASTGSSPVEGWLHHGGDKVRIERGLALIEDPSAGPWRIESESGALRSVRVYSDTRYKWVLRDKPAEFSLLVREASIKLALHDTEARGAPIHPDKLYSSYPVTAECTIATGSGDSHEILMAWSADIGMYVAALPDNAALEPGELRVAVRLDGLVFANGMVAPDIVVHTTIDVGDAVDFGLYLVDEDDEYRIGGVKGVHMRRGGVLKAATDKGVTP